MLFSKLVGELFICVAKIIHEESILRTPKNLTILHTVKNIDLFFHDYFRTCYNKARAQVLPIS